MPLTYRDTPAVTTSGTTAETTWSVNKQSGTQAGDWIFIYLYTATASGMASVACTGFTVKADANGFGGILYKQATGSEGASFSITGLPGHSVTTLIATIAGGATSLDPATMATPSSGGSGTSLAVASITLANSGDWCLWFCANQNGSSGAGFAITPPSGFTSQVTNGAASGNATLMLADNESAAAGATGTKTGTFGGSTYYSGVMVGLTPGVFTMSGAASLDGEGSMTSAGATVVVPETASLDGEGSMTVSDMTYDNGAASLSGSSAMTSEGADLPPGSGFGLLSGSGTMTAGRGVIWAEGALLSGSGTMTPLFSARYGNAILSGSGSISNSLLLGYPAALSGSGTMTVIKVLGGLVLASSGDPISYAYPGTSQVAVAAPGSSDWMYLGQLGIMTALTYSYACPGGCDQMTATIMVPASYRNQMFNPGWQVRITRGGHQVWDGKMDEPVPTASGWNLTATGTGNLGQNFVAMYTSTWPSGEPDQAVNAAIARGLPWINPGVGTPAGAWYGQEVDPGAQTITALLNLICTRGGLTWYVNSQPGGYPGDDLSVFPLPTVPNRLLVCSSPVARTLGGDINTIWIRYESSADTTSTSGGDTPAVYATTSVSNAASVAAHGVIETYIDLSDAGVMDAAAAAAVGNAVLSIYVRASFAGPFTAGYGQLLNTGGAAIDPGTDQAATMVRLILTDYAYGGEVTPQFPVTFIVGAYEWDDFAEVATITPYQSVDQSLTGLLSLESSLLTPIAASS